ncbi:unnamed protein product [Paramecium octaurelia]|uniref:mitogen-activated protein kinase n=1 Tax=Paramecium octaurelia TaxID=43137 RepID=A0A8S1TUJ4_PAROT|nr:unnamed protein product [Paramecium octaurelia]
MQQLNSNDETSSIDENISKYYQIIEFKGKGAYGIIWKAIDKQTKKIVALKKVFDAFSNDTDAQRTYREVMYLQQLTQHENIVKLLRVHRAMNMKDLYMTFEYVESDLHKVIRANLLQTQHVIYILYQLLKCLKYIHSGGLIHRDLKPSNILIDQECRIKLADFGLARLANEMDETAVMTEYVATRWYRAPEILLGSPLYSKAVDMWSVGCILAEMIMCKSLFAGQSTLNQLEKIVEVIGRPSQDDLNQINAPLADKIFREIQNSRRRPLTQFIKTQDDIIDFIQKCLTWNPQKRITIEEAFCHSLLNEFRGSEPELNYPGQIKIDLPENVKFDRKKYREILYKLDINYQKQQYIRSLIQEDHIPSTLKNNTRFPHQYQTQFKPVNHGIEMRQVRKSRSSIKQHTQPQQYHSQVDIQNQILISQSLQQQNQYPTKQKQWQNRVKTLPENHVEKIVPIEPKSPVRGRYFSQNKIPQQAQMITSTTPTRSKSMKNRKYNDSLDFNQYLNNSSTMQKLLTTYLNPKRPTKYNFKKVAIRNKTNMDKTFIKKHIASIHNIDAASVISLLK